MDPISHLIIRALNHLIQGEHWAQERLRVHSGAQVLIDAGGLVKLRMSIDEHGLFQIGDAESNPNVAITLPTDIPARLLFDRDRLFSSIKLGGGCGYCREPGFRFA